MVENSLIDALSFHLDSNTPAHIKLEYFRLIINYIERDGQGSIPFNLRSTVPQTNMAEALDALNTQPISLDDLENVSTDSPTRDRVKQIVKGTHYLNMHDNLRGEGKGGTPIILRRFLRIQ